MKPPMRMVEPMQMCHCWASLRVLLAKHVGSWPGVSMQLSRWYLISNTPVRIAWLQDQKENLLSAIHLSRTHIIYIYFFFWGGSQAFVRLSRVVCHSVFWALLQKRRLGSQEWRAGKPKERPTPKKRSAHKTSAHKKPFKPVHTKQNTTEQTPIQCQLVW